MLFCLQFFADFNAIAPANIGHSISRFWVSLFGGQDARIIVVAFDVVAKAAILYNLKLGEVVPAIPTVGFSVGTCGFKSFSFTIEGVGGHDEILLLWRHLLQ